LPEKRRMPMKAFIAMFLVPLFVVGCTPASKHRAQVQDDSADLLTVGKVQREIRVGMSSAEVVQVLGSPNIVSTDENRLEVWVYDKVASDVTYSTSSGYATLILLGIAKDSGSVSRQQRTLTIVVKFDDAGKVRDFAYHSTKF
jgi:outer membrane protein assembly factor BamE (lipoprotein component of BamABCDE complex)